MPICGDGLIKGEEVCDKGIDPDCKECIQPIDDFLAKGIASV